MEKEILEKLLASALKLLSRRPQSRQEIHDKLNRYLKRQQIKDAEIYINEVLQYLEKNDYLDDQEFSQWFMRQREVFRPRSRKGLFYELLQKGIPKTVIEMVLEDYDEKKACLEIIKRKSNLPPEKIKEHLLRLGFSYETLREIKAV